MVVFNYLGHLIIGAIIGYLVADNSISFICIIIGSLLPDIDLKNSTLGRYNPIARFMKHRGHCHSLIGTAMISLPFIFWSIAISEMIFIGCLGHLLGDKICSLLPKRKRFKLKIW